MRKHLDKDLERLKKEILAMGGMVEESIRQSLRALFDKRSDEAKEVIKKDNEVDLKENEIEEECLKLLALHQPVAGDLRYIITVLKVNNDLERMGDYCVNIAERALHLAKLEELPLPKDFNKGAEIVQKMVRDSLSALVNRDTESALKVWEEDPKVDTIHREMFEELQTKMRGNPLLIDACISTLSVFRYLERIADLATNIAEDIIFMVKGEIVRHQLEE